MSQVATVELEIKDLESLAAAAERCGLVFKRGQTTFRMFLYNGALMTGAYDDVSHLNIAAGDRGKCDHALTIEGNSEAYEIGVLARDGKFHLLFDPHAGGYGLMEKVASADDPAGVGRLLQAYGVEVAKKAAKKKGFRVQEKIRSDGSIRLVCKK